MIAQISKEWGITTSNMWSQSAIHIWGRKGQSHLPFGARLFIRRHVDGFSLGTVLGGQSIVSTKCLFCTISEEYNQHPFVTCPRSRAI